MIDVVFQGDCLDVLPSIEDDFVDLVYLDPPFFTKREHAQVTRDGTRTFQFSDSWESRESYISFLRERLGEIHRVLKPSGSVFFHCDRNAAHLARFVLEDTFGCDNFRSEIIWHYRRWANGSNKLLPAHQTILFFSKSASYQFNTQWVDYSPATNLDQIWQKRSRDHRNKAVYARNAQGDIESNGEKKGVPLSDVWDIPFLNPKAKERTGYPTQKPLLLLERIVELVTRPGDIVLDPFCGSGTALVAAGLLNRHFIGIDASPDAVELSRRRLAAPVRSRSGVLELGRAAYENTDAGVSRILDGIDSLRVQRNSGIDAFLKNTAGGGLIPIRVQRQGETVHEAATALFSAGIKKGCAPMILIQTHDDITLNLDFPLPDEIILVPTHSCSIPTRIEEWNREPSSTLASTS